MVNLWDNESQCTPDLSNFTENHLSLIISADPQQESSQVPISVCLQSRLSPKQMCTSCEPKSQTKTSLNFKAGYHVKYTFNAPIHMAVIAEHQFAMFGAMYSMCLRVVTWQRSNSCSHWDLISSVPLFFFLCARLNRETKGYKVLIITRCPLIRWKRDLSHVTLSP